MFFTPSRRHLREPVTYTCLRHFQPWYTELYRYLHRLLFHTVKMCYFHSVKITSYCDVTSYNACSAIFERNTFKTQRKCNKQKIQWFLRLNMEFFLLVRQGFKIFSIVLRTCENVKKNPVSLVKPLNFLYVYLSFCV